MLKGFSDMTTITPTAAYAIPLHVTLTSPLHHGAGSSGNTALLRTQEVVQPDGTLAHVPFVSAASVRHGLRDALAWHLATTIGLESISKAAVDLLWSGGAVTKTGAETDLAMARRVEEFLPMLSLLGYAAQSDIVEGTLRASDLILVCQENDWRLPEPLQGRKRAAAYRGEEFGTRHDIATSPVARLVEQTGLVVDKTTQMIFATQVLLAGAQLYGELSLTPSATPQHRLVLDAAIGLWDGMLAAKTATGYGRTSIPLEDTTDQVGEWTQHLLDHKTDILQLVAEITA